MRSRKLASPSISNFFKQLLWVSAIVGYLARFVVTPYRHPYFTSSRRPRHLGNAWRGYGTRKSDTWRGTSASELCTRVEMEPEQGPSRTPFNAGSLPEESACLQRERWEANLNSKKIPTEWMNALVMNYLTTQGHAAAAATFERETGTPQILNPESTAVRMKIRQAIERDGNPAEAIDQVVDVNPEIVEERPELLFRLKKQEFIELVKQKKTDTALRFAEEELARRVEGDEGLLRELESAMALLLFDEPENSPLGQFLSESYTHETADLLNASILASETKAGDGRSRLPVMLHLLLWLEARANEVVKKEWGNEDTPNASELSYVPRIRLDGHFGTEENRSGRRPDGTAVDAVNLSEPNKAIDAVDAVELQHALDYANTVFGAAEVSRRDRAGATGRAAGTTGVDMDISEEEDGNAE